jgi:5-methylcytosine-specific restriction endonuclease McrA
MVTKCGVCGKIIQDDGARNVMGFCISICFECNNKKNKLLNKESMTNGKESM